jgi:hypothetical protein
MPKSGQRWRTYASISTKLPRIDEQVDALARGQLALGMLGLDALFAAALERLLLHLLESCDGFGIGHRGISTSSVKTPSMLFG